MSPLDAATPRALFGEAVDDARALKRAYAKVIREYGPETHPDVFQHVRRLYEEAVAALERRAQAPAEPIPGAPADPEAQRAWVDERLAGLDPAELPGAIAVLEAAEGNGWAMMAAAGLLEASAPERVVGWLLGRVGKAEEGFVAYCASEMLRRRPGMVDDPAWPALVAAMELPTQRRLLATGALEALLALERPAEAWEAWMVLEAEIRSEPTEWAGRAAALLRAAGPGLPEETIDRWIERFHAADLGLDDWTADALSRVACDVVAIGRAAKDPAVHPSVLRGVRDLLGAAPVERVLMLGALGGEPTWAVALDRLAAHHPGITGLVWRHVLATTQRDGFLTAWRTKGAPPTVEAPPGVLAALDRAVDAAWAPVEQARAAAETRRQRGQKLQGITFLGGMAALVVATGVLSVSEAAAFGLYLVCVGLVWSSLHVSLGATAADLQRAAVADEAARGEAAVVIRAAVRAACRDGGLWIHEIAAARAHDRRLDGVVDALLADPLSDLGVIGDAHVRRAATPAPEPT